MIIMIALIASASPSAPHYSAWSLPAVLLWRSVGPPDEHPAPSCACLRPFAIEAPAAPYTALPLLSLCLPCVLPGFRGVASAAAAATAAAATAGSAPPATTIAFPALSVLQAFLIPTLTFTNFGFAGITLILVIAAPLPFPSSSSSLMPPSPSLPLESPHALAAHRPWRREAL
eukprot:scaffold13810_cov151-Isochrysis_galbana.AAC.2